jgi:hypothetical protein
MVRHPFKSVSRAQNRSIGRNRSIGPKQENPWNEGVALRPIDRFTGHVTPIGKDTVSHEI